MAAIEIVVRIDEPGVPRETLETYARQMMDNAARLGHLADLEDKDRCLPARIIGVVKPEFEALVPYIAGEAK